MDQPTTAPKVSIIVPAYNREQVIKHTLDSVLQQTFSDWELLVVDDSSTDSTASIVESYESLDPRVRLIRHSVNRGVSAARNTALDASAGEYIAFLDSDDLWLPTWLEKMLEPTRTAPRAALFIQSKAIRRSGDENFLLDSDINQLQNCPTSVPKRPRGENEALGDYVFIFSQPILTMTLLISGDIARRERFQEGLKRHQDHDYFLRVARHEEKHIFVNEVLSIYRARHSGIQGTKAPKDIQQLLKLQSSLKPVLTSKAYIAFGANKIGYPALDQGYTTIGVRLLLNGVRAGVTPAAKAAFALVRHFTPQPLKSAVRDQILGRSRI